MIWELADCRLNYVDVQAPKVVHVWIPQRTVRTLEIHAFIGTALHDAQDSLTSSFSTLRGLSVAEPEWQMRKEFTTKILRWVLFRVSASNVKLGLQAEADIEETIWKCSPQPVEAPPQIPNHVAVRIIYDSNAIPSLD